MSQRLVYLNGEFVAENEAKISVFDRGILFADAVYEGVTVINNKLIDFDGHIRRLERSLNEIDNVMPMSAEDFREACLTLIDKNNVDEGFIYLQVSRGAEDRDFLWSDNLTPTVVMFTQKKNIVNVPALQKGLKVKAFHDTRWARRDIKTTMLLAQSLVKQRAKKQGFDDAWLYDENTDMVNEGSSNNAYIITQDGVLKTRPASNDILNGITRQAILRLCEQRGITFQEQAFSLSEAKQAKEAFISSASTIAMPVVQIDDTVIGDGKPGALTLELRKIYLDEMV